MCRPMTRHSFPLLALLALPFALLAGCGGGSVGGSTSSSTAASTSTTAQHAASSSTAAAKKQRGGARTTARAARPARPSPHAFAAARITPAAATALAKQGAIILPVATGGPGKVTAFGQAEIPGKGIIHVATARPQVLRRAGIVRLTLVLTPLARAQLAAGRPIDMFVAVGFSKGLVFDREEVHLTP